MLRKYWLILTVGILGSRTCIAFDYLLTPKFSNRDNYYSNIRMQPRNKTPIWLNVLSPGADLIIATENSELKSNFTWNQQLYLNDSSLNFEEQLFNVKFKSSQERFLWKLGGAYNKTSALTTEETGVGPILSQVARNYAFVNPSVTYAFDSRNTFELAYNYNDTKYNRSASNSFLANYDYHQINGIYTHLYSERSSFNLNLSSSRYHTSFSDQTIFNHVAQVGWQYQFSEQFLFYIAGGVNYAQAESHFDTNIPASIIFNRTNTEDRYRLTTDSTREISNNALGEVYQFRLQRNLERGRLSLNFSQNQSPTAQGLQTRTNIGISNTFNLSERWTAGLYASYSMNESTSEQSARFNRTNYSVSPNINWKWTPEVKIQLSYTYRNQKYATSDQPAEGHVGELLFIYQPEINRLVK